MVCFLSFITVESAMPPNLPDGCLLYVVALLVFTSSYRREFGLKEFIVNVTISLILYFWII